MDIDAGSGTGGGGGGGQTDAGGLAWPPARSLSAVLTALNACMAVGTTAFDASADGRHDERREVQMVELQINLRSVLRVMREFLAAGNWPAFYLVTSGTHANPMLVGGFSCKNLRSAQYPNQRDILRLWAEASAMLIEVAAGDMRFFV